MRTRSAKESARTLPRKWIEENWGVVADAPRVAAHRHADPVRISSNRHRRSRPGSAPTGRREDTAELANHVDYGRRISPGKIRQQQQQQKQQNILSSVGLVQPHAGGDSGGVLPVTYKQRGGEDSWERECSPSFAPRGVEPTLGPPRPPKGPTRSRWPTRSVEASVLRYIQTAHREKVRQGKIPSAHAAGNEGKLQPGGNKTNPRKSANYPGTFPTVAWPEHAEMTNGDVVVTVEHCHSCHKHRMTTRHDPEVYLRHANAVKELLIESLREAPIRLAVILKKAPLRPKALSSSRDGRGCSATASSRRDRRVGAFEIQVAARHPDRTHGIHAQVMHSKLATGRWPRLGADTPLTRRMVTALESWGFEARKRPIVGAEMDADDEGAHVQLSSPQRRRSPQILIPWEFDRRKHYVPRDIGGLDPRDASRGRHADDERAATTTSASNHRECPPSREARGNTNSLDITATEVASNGSHDEKGLVATISALEFATDTETAAREMGSTPQNRSGGVETIGKDGACDDVDDDVLGVSDERNAADIGEDPEEEPLDGSDCAHTGAGAADKVKTELAAARADKTAASVGGTIAAGLEKRCEYGHDDSENGKTPPTSSESEEETGWQQTPGNRNGGKDGTAVSGPRRPNRESGGDVAKTDDSTEPIFAWSRSSSTLENHDSKGTRGSPRKVADAVGEHATSSSGGEDTSNHDLRDCARERGLTTVVGDSSAQVISVDDGRHEGACSPCHADNDIGADCHGEIVSVGSAVNRAVGIEATTGRDRFGSPDRSYSSESPRRSRSGGADGGGDESGLGVSVPEEKDEDDPGTIGDEYESDFGSQGGNSPSMAGTAVESSVGASLQERSIASPHSTTEISARLDCEDFQVMDGRGRDEEKHEERVDKSHAEEQKGEEEEEEEEEEEYGDDFDEDGGDCSGEN